VDYTLTCLTRRSPRPFCGSLLPSFPISFVLVFLAIKYAFFSSQASPCERRCCRRRPRDLSYREEVFPPLSDWFWPRREEVILPGFLALLDSLVVSRSQQRSSSLIIDIRATMQNLTTINSFALIRFFLTEDFFLPRVCSFRRRCHLDFRF